MIKTIYIEDEIRNSPRAIKIISKIKHAEIIYINRYSEVFNKKSQNFRLQKLNPSLILAKKYGNLLHLAPEGYGIGNNRNYYFAHMINCVFDCRYCFLQGMFNSANFVVFVNYEDFFRQIEKIIKRFPSDKITFFSGYDCDSLASESTTGFISEALKFFKNLNNAELEIRTKSTFIEPLLDNFIENGVVAYSLTPQKISSKFEIGVPDIEKRLRSIIRLANLGWKIGLRFDPIIYFRDWSQTYNRFFEYIFKNIPEKAIHSVTYGSIRYPNKVYKNIVKLFPEEELFFHNMEVKKNHTGYSKQMEDEIELFVNESISNFIPQEKLYHCFNS